MRRLLVATLAVLVLIGAGWKWGSTSTHAYADGWTWDSVVVDNGGTVPDGWTWD
jgi:hypothetical protein